jgi:hypothetical protein
MVFIKAKVDVDIKSTPLKTRFLLYNPVFFGISKRILSAEVYICCPFDSKDKEPFCPFS